jgi:hypothetical protein
MRTNHMNITTDQFLKVCVCVCVYIYIYIYVCVCVKYTVDKE